MTFRIATSGVLAALALANAAPAGAAPRITARKLTMGEPVRLADLVDARMPTSAPAAAGQDEFGVSMIYPTKAGGETWTLSADPTSDPRFDPQQSIEQNEDGSWKMLSDKVRMNVATSTGYDPAAIVTDRGVIAERGYMQAPNDWTNVEMTGYVRVNEAPEVDNFAWYTRGGRHNDANPCEGSSYKGGLHYDGQMRVEKESWHVSYDQGPYEQATSSIVGRWVGFKTVMRNIEVNGAPAVKIELWLDDAGDGTSWAKTYELVDDGTMGGESSTCGGVDGMPLTWGGPIATFRWDSASDVDFKWLSVREIE